MRFFGGFFRGIGNCFRGFPLLFEKGLWPYMLYPFLLWALMWLGSIWLIAISVEALQTELRPWFRLDAIPDQGHWLSFAKPYLNHYSVVVLGWVLKLVLWFFSRTFSKYLLLMVLSPLFAMLSEKAEEKLSGRQFPFSFPQFLKDLLRGIGISLRNMLLEYLIIITCFVLTLFFPPLVVISAPFLLIVSWYFLGFTLLDYNFERHRLSIRSGLRWVRQHRGLACGIGLVYSFFMTLPTFAGDLIGLLLGPALATLGATISFIEINSAVSRTAQPVSHV